VFFALVGELPYLLVPVKVLFPAVSSSYPYTLFSLCFVFLNVRMRFLAPLASFSRGT